MTENYACLQHLKTRQIISFFFSQVEPHYGTDYQVEKIPKDVILSWKSGPTNPQLKLPQTNELIDKNQIRFQIFLKIENFYMQQH